MKKKLKLKTVLCAMTVMGISSVAAPVVMAAEIPDGYFTSALPGISTCTEEKEWLYTVIDGHLYKRLWNYTYGCWDSDLILVA
jgi:hypothetical protein